MRPSRSPYQGASTIAHTIWLHSLKDATSLRRRPQAHVDPATPFVVAGSSGDSTPSYEVMEESVLSLEASLVEEMSCAPVVSRIAFARFVSSELSE